MKEAIRPLIPFLVGVALGFVGPLVGISDLKAQVCAGQISVGAK